MFKYFLLFAMLVSSVFAEGEKFFLLLGPSGVGKSTLIHHLKAFDSRFVYITPYTTRPLRPGEVDKVHVDVEIIQQLEEAGKLLTVNFIYGIYYATPKELIERAFLEGNFPILDWPVDKMDVMLENYRDKLFTIYVEPESLEILEKRLSKDSRDKDGKRFSAGKEELEKYHQGEFNDFIDMKIVNIEGQDSEVALKIYEAISLINFL